MNAQFKRLKPAALSGQILALTGELDTLLYLLLLPVIVPSTLAAYSVAGEREQGTLEPLLTTQFRRQEFILGKAAAVMIPTFGALLHGVRALPRRSSAVRPFRRRLSRIPPGSGTSRPGSLRPPVGRLGYLGWNGDVCQVE
jgi:hypothetical protein